MLLWEGDKGGDEKISIFEVNVFYMIKVNELRIGNRVWFEDDDLCMTTEGIVEYIKTDGVYKAGRVGENIYMVGLIGRNGKKFLEHIIDLEPIPLTPEILESLGLPDQEINEKGCDWFHRGNFLVGKTKYHYHFHKNSKRLTLAVVLTLEKGSDTTAFAWDIYYVHQLQNLYHALTFKELNVVDGKSYLCSR